jgi:hypothetical protein
MFGCTAETSWQSKIKWCIAIFFLDTCFLIPIFTVRTNHNTKQWRYKMENIAFAQQIVDINRVAVDNAWNIITLLQTQTERFVRASIEQSNQIAEEGQRIIEEWTKEYNRGRQAIQDVAEENRISLEQLFSPQTQPKEAAKPKKTK